MKSLGSIFFCAAMLCASGAHGAEPANYYSSCEGRKGQSLLTALESVVGNHTNVGYNGLWTLYQTSDTRANGTIWDMYSTKEYKYKTDQCGSYSVVGSCYNREHSMPKSWFNDASPMVSDAFHIYPTDGKVNGQRSNYPYGECAGGTTLPASGGIKALGRLGSSTYAGYTGTVFEPDDEYKGDFARTYFYMAAAYNSRISSWNSDMLAGNKYPVFTSWAINMLLKWHRQDPVSDKEIKRNDAVYAAQNNRNPFIDHPELAEHIWGNLQSEDWHPAGETTPALTLPVDNSSLDLGVTVPGFPRKATVRIKGVALTGNVTLSVSGTAFSVSPATVSKSNAVAGADVTVTYNPAAEGNHSGVLTITCGSLTAHVNLSGRAISTLPAGPVTAVGDDSFEARWSNVGDADARGEYTLDVQLDGVSIDEFPRSVNAADEYFLVEGLEPATTYTYYIKSAHLTSAIVTVTTLEPRPLVEFLFDGGALEFFTEPGVPSEAAELLVNVENITEDVTVSVAAPFELSTDKSTWRTSITLTPDEDRIYLRLNSAVGGTFMTSITASAGSYHNDEAEAHGEVSEAEYLNEDFEVVDSKVASYNPPAYQGTGCVWNFKDTGIWAEKTEAHTGKQAARMGKTSSSVMEMADALTRGVGTVTFWAKRFGSDGEATLKLEYNVGGDTWYDAGTIEVKSSTYTKYSVEVKVPGNVRLRLRQTSGARVNIDDFTATSYLNVSFVSAENADYHRWDAFCRGGELVIEASEALTVAVYALDGTIIYQGDVTAGETSLNVSAGLYIVAVDDFARRVVVK